MTWIYPDEKTFLLAGRLNAFGRLPLADALIAAIALLRNSILVHKDPELASWLHKFGKNALSPRKKWARCQTEHGTGSLIPDRTTLNQTTMIVDALRAKKLPIAYHAFEGEQQIFRKAATIRLTLKAELYFYSRIFGFKLVDRAEPVEIQRL